MSGGGVPSSVGGTGLGMGDLDRAPGAPANIMGHTAAVTPGATSDLEDPPGLYEKVRTVHIMRLSLWKCAAWFLKEISEGGKLFKAKFKRG